MAPQAPCNLFVRGGRYPAGCSQPAWNDGGGREKIPRQLCQLACNDGEEDLLCGDDGAVKSFRYYTLPWFGCVCFLENE